MEMDDEKDPTIKPYRASCLCCSIRTGLIIWTLTVSLIAIIPLIVMLSTGIIDLTEKKNIPSFCFGLLDGIAFICGLTAAVLKRRRLLILCFWFALFVITYCIVLLVFTILLVFDVFGNVHFASKTTEYLVLAFLIVWYSVYVVCQMVYAQMLKFYAKELQKRAEDHVV